MRGLRLLGWLAAGVLGLLLVLALLVAAVDLGWQRDRIRGWLEAQASAALAAELRIGALEGPLHRGVTARDVTLVAGGETLLSLDTLRLELGGLRFSPRPVLVLEEVELVAPRLSLVQQPDGGWNLARLGGDAPAEEPPAPDEPARFGVAVERFSVVDGRIDLRAANARAPLVLSLEGRELRWPFEGRARRALEAELELAANGAEVLGVAVEEGRLALRIDGDEARLESLEIVSPAGRLRASGETGLFAWLDGEAARASLEAHFEALDPAPLLADESWHAELAGSLEAQLTRAPGAAPEIALELSLAPGRTPFGQLEGGGLEAQIADGRWRLARASLRGEGVQLDAHGAGPLDAPRNFETLTVDARVEDLSRLPGAEATRGRAELHADLRGPLERIAGPLEAQASGLVLGGRRLGELALEAEAEAGVVRVERLALTGGELALHAEPGARLRLAEAGAIDVESLVIVSDAGRVRLDGGFGEAGFRGLVLSATGLDLGALATLAGREAELGGQLDATLELDGRFAAPEIAGDLALREIRVGEASFDALRARVLTPDAQSYQADGALSRGDQVLARFELRARRGGDAGALLADPEFRARLDAESLELAELAPALPEAWRGLTGRAGLALTARGGEPLPRVEGRVTLADLRLARAGETLGPLDASLELEGDTLHIAQLTLQDERLGTWQVPGEARLRRVGERFELSQIRLENGAQSLAIEGRVGTEAAERLTVRLDQLEVAPLAALAAPEHAMGGTLSGELTATGRWTAPELAGELQWTRPSVGETRAERLALTLATEASRYLAQGKLTGAGAELLDVELEVPRDALAEPGRIAQREATRLALDARALDLALLAPLLPGAVRAPAGELTGSLRVRGGAPAPHVEGQLSVRNGSLAVPLLAQTFAPIELAVELDARALRVQTLQIGEPGHQASATGSVALGPDFAPGALDLTLGFDHFPVSRSRLLSSDLDGQLTLRGSAGAPVLKGTLTLEELLAQLPDTRDRALKEIRVVQRGENGKTELREGKSEPGSFEQAVLDLELSVPPDSWVRGRGAEIELKGTLKLAKRAGGPLATTGRLETIRGRYQLHGRVFDVREGRAVFDGATPPDPLLAITAVYEVREIEILAQIQGRASDPEIALRSEPPLPDADVLAYLLFGRPAGESGQQQALQAAAVQAAAGLAASQLERLLVEQLPIDSLGLRMQEEGRPAFLDVGKRLNDRLFVRYGRDLAGEGGDEVKLEWQLSPSWSLESEIEASGSAGLDVLWRRDY